MTTAPRAVELLVPVERCLQRRCRGSEERKGVGEGKMLCAGLVDYLLLNGGGIPAGCSRSLVCLGPRPDVEIKYKIKVHGCESGVLSLARTVPCIRVLERFEARKFLFVPDAEWGPSGHVSISIRIG
ncbi:uncharacterized protein C2845_PM15G02070 [Panicum miliaceum]|uniref:Uncharacterized protein n=1 Tax=Panicum miliaceum TaxID=4540 RepID=A0A3L6Q6K6_PANMI|nr:uncharacterized protein C2845_PM15G02070 [Panicum miliaceum]